MNQKMRLEKVDHFVDILHPTAEFFPEQVYNGDNREFYASPGSRNCRRGRGRHFRSLSRHSPYNARARSHSPVSRGNYPKNHHQHERARNYEDEQYNLNFPVLQHQKENCCYRPPTRGRVRGGRGQARGWGSTNHHQPLIRMRPGPHRRIRYR